MGIPDARGQQRLVSRGQEPREGSLLPYPTLQVSYPCSPPGGGGTQCGPSWDGPRGTQTGSSQRRRGPGWGGVLGEGSTKEGKPAVTGAPEACPEGQPLTEGRGHNLPSQERPPEHRQPLPWHTDAPGRPPVCHQGLLRSHGPALGADPPPPSLGALTGSSGPGLPYTSLPVQPEPASPQWTATLPLQGTTSESVPEPGEHTFQAPARLKQARAGSAHSPLRNAHTAGAQRC